MSLASIPSPVLFNIGAEVFDDKGTQELDIIYSIEKSRIMQYKVVKSAPDVLTYRASPLSLEEQGVADLDLQSYSDNYIALHFINDAPGLKSRWIKSGDRYILLQKYSVTSLDLWKKTVFIHKTNASIEGAYQRLLQTVKSQIRNPESPTPPNVDDEHQEVIPGDDETSVLDGGEE